MTLPPNQPMKPTTVHSMHVYEVRPRNDKRGVDLISEVLPFSRPCMASRTRSATLSATQSITADHAMR
jgi:hypothetical protein